MVHLTLAGVSEDGRHLLLVSDAGVEFTLDNDAPLRAALRAETSRTGQLENTMDSALRPRDIQARIRAGETPEAVAEAARTSLDRIMAYAGPVLAEREHVAQRAQRSSVRRRGGDGSTARTLGDAVATHLRAHNVDPDQVEWDSWRREDGRWSLVAQYTAAERQGTAEFTFDLPGNYVLLDNDDARWVVGEAVATTPAPEAHDDLERARQRRLTAAPDSPGAPGAGDTDPALGARAPRTRVDHADQELPLGDDAIEMVSPTDAPTDAPAGTPAAGRPAARAADLGSEAPLEAFLDTAAPRARPDAPDLDASEREEAADAAALDDAPVEAAPEPTPEPAPEPVRRPVKKSRGRASVPSWDEIMFGGGKQD